MKHILSPKGLLLNITKSVTLKAAQADVCAATRSGTETIINCVDGPTRRSS